MPSRFPARCLRHLSNLSLLTLLTACAFPAHAQSGDLAELSPIDQVTLVDGWSATTINTAIFRHHGVLTVGDVQYAAVYTDPQSILVARRDLKTNQLQTHILAGNYTLRDAHNVISLGVDADGYLHMVYDLHGQRLNYRRSLEPGAIDQWTDEIPMTGQRESSLTYPQFLMPTRNGQPGPLLFLARQGGSGNGDAELKIYDTATSTWSDIGTIARGSGQNPWTSNPYWNHPALGPDGSIHLTFTWRTHSLPGNRINNINIDHMVSDDFGHTWHTKVGHELRIPVTQVNSETIRAISPGTNLINQTSSALDSQGRLHVAYYADDPDGIPQYQHLWWDGREWRNDIVSARTENFELAGVGTLNIPISRPEIIVDREDRVYFIYRADFTGQRMVIQRLDPPDYLPESAPRVLWNEPVGYAEPIIDRLRWRDQQILSMLIQFNDQPLGDYSDDLDPNPLPVRIVDWDVVVAWDGAPRSRGAVAAALARRGKIDRALQLEWERPSPRAFSFCLHQVNPAGTNRIQPAACQGARYPSTSGRSNPKYRTALL